MKDIRESLKGTPSLLDFIIEQCDTAEGFDNLEQMDEGLKDIFASLKRKFKQVSDWVFGWVARISNKLPYWCPVDDEGKIMPAVTPLTACQAYADGYINKNSTLVATTSRKAQSLTGCKTKAKDAISLYGSGNTLNYWKQFFGESEVNSETPINEVKMHTEDPQAKYNVVDTKELKFIINKTLTSNKLPRLLIYGAPGIGKTAIMMSVLDELPDGKDWTLIVKTLSNETPENFTLPKYVDDNQGQTLADDIPKTWMPLYRPTGDKDRDALLDKQLGKGLLFIDELSRAQPQVLNVVLPLINEGIFNGWKIGSGWKIIVASNRAEDEESGQANIGNALSSRFNIVYFEPTYKDWEEWAKTQGFISPLLLSWLNLPESENMSGGKYFYWDPDESDDSDNPSQIMCNPRTWTNAMRTLAVYADTASLEGFDILDIPRNILGMALNGNVPREAVDSFMSFLDVIRSVGNFDDVVRSVWKGGKDIDIKSRTMRQVALPLAQLIITAHKDKYPTQKEFENMCDWVVKNGSDQMASYILDILQEVFAGMLPKNQRSLIFVWHKKMAKLKKEETPEEFESTKQLHETYYEALFKKWGFDFDTIPDWSKGLATLSKKFGQTFQSYEVDGMEAFG